MSSFLPDEFKGIPQGPSNYFKFVDGENTFRVLSPAVIGYEYWMGEEKDRKVFRVKDWDEVPDEFKNNKDNRNNAKYFWAFVVYNLATESVQILEVKQKKVMNGIEALDKSKSWGDPTAYNIIVTKTKTGPEPRDVEYSVMPEPKEKLDPAILKKYKEMEIDLDLLFKGEDPFKKDEKINPDDVPADL